jgi:hypothetical protein
MDERSITMTKLILFSALFAIVAGACKPKTGSATAILLQQDTVKDVVDRIDTVQISSDIKYYYDTLRINGSMFIQTMNEYNYGCCLVAINGDTIVPFSVWNGGIELLDINKDGNTDIRVFIVSNTDNLCDNYLFDKKESVFQLIENCRLDFQKIEGTEFYYSYLATGCSDMNWMSELGKIDNYRVVTYGCIVGYGCENEEQKIEIYKILDDHEKLIETLPYETYIPKFEDKWSFIKQYWEINYQKFERVVIGNLGQVALKIPSVKISKTNLVDFDFSDIWMDNRIDYLGYIGDNYQRLHINFNIIRKISPTKYSVTGYSEVKSNRCNFSGTIEIEELHEQEELDFGVDVAQKIDSFGKNIQDTPDDKISIQIGFTLYKKYGRYAE